MTAETVPERAIDRRFLMRGGAVLAGAAGIAAVGAVVAPTAQAADNASLLIGANNDGTLTTTLTKAPGGATPTLSLVNTTGPSLKLNPLADNYSAPLAVGEIVNTSSGPLIGVDLGNGVGVQNTYLVTDLDLQDFPAPYAIPTERMLDTRNADSRATIIGSSTDPFDSKGQLKAGAYIDVGVAPAGANISAAFVNLTAVKPLSEGYLVVYPSGEDVPVGSTVNFHPKATSANSAFVALGVVNNALAMRVYAAKASHLIIDLTGVVFGGREIVQPPADPDLSPRQAQQARRVSKMRSAVQKTVGR